MGPVLKSFCLLYLAVFLSWDLPAQNPFRPPSFPGSRNNLRRMILLVRKVRPVLLKISERSIFHGTVEQGPSARPVYSRVSRIRGDSIYLDSAGYHFRDLGSFDLPGFNHYSQSDSLNWRVFFPPDSIYHDRWTYSIYMRQMAGMLKNDKVTERSGRSFHNILKINLTKIANLEIAIDYERRISGRWSFEGEAGYQVAADNHMGDDAILDAYPLYKYSGINIVAGPKYYIGKIPYLQLVVIYRYLDMDLSRTKLGSPGGYYGLQYQYRNDLGGGLRFGLLSRVSQSMIVDAYLGGGIKACMIDQFIYGVYYYHDSLAFHWNNANHSADHNYVVLLMPVINAGIKIGVGF